MNWLLLHVDTIGFWAAVLTTIGFVPQVVRSWQLGGDELSWAMLMLFGTGIGLWFLYGYLLMSAPLMLANGLTGLQVLVLLGFKLRCRARRGIAARRHSRVSMSDVGQ
jgi:MtN3 and saliva related transmembrane protein